MHLPIYLDYNATTPVDKRVLETMLPYFSEKFGNAASSTHHFGWVAESAVKQARQKVATLLNCEEQEIIFTSGSTEAINLAIKGVYENYSAKGNHIITLATEHKAVIDTCNALEKKGASITFLPVKSDGLIDLQLLKESITKKTILVSVMYANNETGVVQPIQEIAEIVHQKNCIFMSDATQAIGKLPVDVQQDGIDLLCLSAHKIYGPKGVGVLFVRRKNPRVSIAAQIDGGGHERGLRSGTLNITGIVGLGKAIQLAQQEMEADAKRMRILRDKLENALLFLNNIFINGNKQSRLPNVSNISFPDVNTDILISKLKDLAVSTGSACNSILMEPSHVLKAMGIEDRAAKRSIRFSLGKYTTEEEIDYAVKKIKAVFPDL